ncbi:MAG TPA: DnaJ domain-containing protein [Anaerolineales bacterium]|nr:DnaJ domain-containing protein [Anaerolineales bacterium]
MSSKQPNYYATLGVFRDASLEEIKRAYFEAAQRLHPDKNKAPGETELFLEIQQAYEVLSNPKRRAQYDATLPPDEEEANSAVLHQIYFSRSNLVKLNESQLIYVLLEVGPRNREEKLPAPPLNVALVLDRSTSMQGEKMDVVKSAAIQLLRSLRPEDIFSVVTFSDRAEVIVPAAYQRDLHKLESRIQMLQPSGATEIFQGLELGMQEVRRGLDPARVNHIILLTDGHTYGDEQASLQLAEEAAKQNIGISGMGIGNDWNDIFLDALASATGGSSAYIAKPQDIQRILVEKFKALANTFADEVVLDFTSQEGVDLNYAFRIQPEGGPVALERPLRLGPILQDVPLNILFEFVVQPSATVNDSVTLINGSLKISIAARPQPVPPIRLRLNREVRTDAPTEPPPTKILSALSRLTLYRLQERARSEADAGNIETATRHLKNLASHLLSQGEPTLARTALLEAESLQQTRSWSTDGGKEIKYSTRALLLSGAKEKGK